MEREYRMSQARFEELQKELTYLKTIRSDEVAEQIKVARGFGDLSENSEYDEAKNEQGKLYSRMTNEHVEAMKHLCSRGNILLREILPLQYAVQCHAAFLRFRKRQMLVCRKRFDAFGICLHLVVQRRFLRGGFRGFRSSVCRRGSRP